MIFRRNVSIPALGGGMQDDSVVLTRRRVAPVFLALTGVIVETYDEDRKGQRALTRFFWLC
jgi:hypothetical protein